MAVTPDDVRKSEKVLSIADALEKEIDRELLKGSNTVYIGTSFSPYVGEVYDITEAVMAEIIERYKKVGWRNIKFKYNGRYSLIVTFQR